MDYAQLCTNIQDVCEQTFTDSQLAMFTEQAEQKIYQTVQLPVEKRNQLGTMSANNPYLLFPSDLLYVYSLAVIDGSGNYTFLLPKDTNFIREAYPNPTSTGLPKHYAFFNSTTFLLGPTPTSNYGTEIHYGYYPQSIVTAGTTWLGDHADAALLNGALIEAIRFQKGEPDVIANYEKLYAQAIGLLSVMGEVRMQQDTYRNGTQIRKPS
jgi:hypothetical protein